MCRRARSDIVAARARDARAGTHNIASVNMSLGGGSFPCLATDSHKPAIDNLRSIGIATVIAAGNGRPPRS